ncbi:pleiotropic drug resistance protein 3-like isoform X1 [Canna indica]|uniref:Pleiotropic drug resistance protein 3-like isoform X1 n=1 Tax=Canna indica TaxID=4628 RepID=A0AAQ3KM19_9LILI|nr:pleiotropic drug resistance protein 3-like isoform X1 [Canna indica]
MELIHRGRSMSSKSISKVSSLVEEEEEELQLAAIERVTSKREMQNGHASLSRLATLEKSVFIDNLIKNVNEDNRQLLQRVKERLDKVDLKLPTVEVRYKNLSVEARCRVVHGKPLPTVWNTTKGVVLGVAKAFGIKSEEANIRIIQDASGTIKPSRLTLLLGPPGCGKTTLLLALAGKLSQPLKLIGNVSYNGFQLEEFVPEKTAAYVSQHDLHLPQMTVREIHDFSVRCQGVGSKEGIMTEVKRREKLAGIIPATDIETFMKETAAREANRSLQTDYVMKILDLDSCSNIKVGDAMRRGISGGQRKRLTTGEMIVGPARCLFMDEISNGLDSSTTFQIVSCLQQLVHITEVTALIALLQPTPETFDLFDDIILMTEGKIIYHGPRTLILDFFESCGFRCPERKAIPDFLQEVISRKDQAQYWKHNDIPHSYFSAENFVKQFADSHIGKELDEELSKPYDRSLSNKKALTFSTYTLTKWELFKTCMAREFLLIKRDSFIYMFKTTQLVITGLITMTVFLHTHMRVDSEHSNYFMASLFYTIIRLSYNGIAELALTVSRLPVFYKQRELHFYPAWAYSISACLLKVPFSLLEAFLWTALTYYTIGYSPEPQRFLLQFILLFALHLMSTSQFRFLASVCQRPFTAAFISNLALLISCIFCGFILPKTSFPPWLKWGFWISPLTYAEIGLTINEFSAPRWKKKNVGHEILNNHGLDVEGYFYWLSLGALFGFALLFNFGYTLALTYLKPPGNSRSISRQQISQKHELKDRNFYKQLQNEAMQSSAAKNGSLVLPFKPLAITFQNLQYYIATPKLIKEKGFTEKRLQLLCDMTGVFRPGILTALMGVSGAGKTTFMDVLSGRKTAGYIEGDIRIAGYPKVQQTFARVSGYCEQSDIHSPNITVRESIIFSAWLRLPPEISSSTKSKFVNEVLQIIELDNIKDNLVGIPGISGLSTEQHKRLTIAVELVANPSIIFMDEPTSGLDARAAAIVIRVVRNIVDTGRTIVCTIHQPSINIFESFDELFLMKRGGQIIYSGPLGKHSCKLIEYFEKIPGIPKIKDKYNPATWMLEITSTSFEQHLGVNFAHLYKNSKLYLENKKQVIQLSNPSAGSNDLKFLTCYPQTRWTQYKACLWKQHHSYWRSPTYNFLRFLYMMLIAIIFGAVFWQQGKEINNAQDVFNILGSMFLPLMFFGINNCTTVLPIVETEKIILYREKYAGMYSSWAYSLAQVTIEIPYIFVQAIIYVGIVYPSLGFDWSARKLLYYYYAIFCSLLCSTYLGMLLASLSATAELANILASAVYTLLSLFSGFLLPRPKIPKWWIWLYWICPTSWTLNGLLTSQYGDLTKEISAFGEVKPLNAFLQEYYGFRNDQLGLVAFMLACYPIIFPTLFAYFIGKLNFQKR